MKLSRKQPRDFVLIDELWPAAHDWSNLYPGKKVWVFMDEYWAALPGDQSYRRLIISPGEGEGWIYKRALRDKEDVAQTLLRIQSPIRQSQLKDLDFKPWLQLEEY